MNQPVVTSCFYFILLSFISVINVYECESAKILCLFPTPAYSHQQPLMELSYALAARGHEMTILTTNPRNEQLKNVREVDVNSMYRDIQELQKQPGSLSLQKRNDAIKMLSQTCKFSNMMFELLIKKPQFIDLLKQSNGTTYDLILYEPIFNSALLGFVKITGNPPVVGIVTGNPPAFIDNPLGNPLLPSYIPLTMLPHTDRMTLYQRFINLYAELYMKYIMESCIWPSQQEYFHQLFGNLDSSVRELEHNKSLLIVATDWSTGYPKPHQPNTIFVGPLHIKKPQPLPQDLKKWMDEAEDGVVYFSLGSNMKGTSVSPHIREMFIEAFKQFPRVRVLWKWEADTDLPGRPDNVLARKWLPQQSILAHPKVKIFISQVGAQSLGEAINYKVPILGVPMFGDQDFNVKKMVGDGAARVLEFNTLSSQEIYDNIRAILINPSYKENMERLWRITNDKPMPAMETAIWWVEYVIRHKGAPHLRPGALDLAWYQLYMFDILAILFALVLITIGSIVYILRFLLQLYKKRNTKLKSKKKKIN